MKKEFTSSKRTTISPAGFTLIELLVVIAIIGLLASVVLYSLGSARTKGVDAATRDNMASIRSQAEIFATNNSNNYTGLCSTDPKVSAMLVNLKIVDTQQAVNPTITAYGTTGAANTITCHDTTSGWAVEAPLNSGFWCVDSGGRALNTATFSLGASDIVCGP